ncbi:MAG: hypothetical protein IKM73_00300 [Acidaminococcaceae bacterium]|nr:hypothetical protein [Acidaminococcaceae bacterium]
MREYRDYSETIKQQVTMRDVAERYGFAVSTRTKKIRCPFHDDKNASLQIYSGNRGWFCFTCGEGGSVIDFVMKYFGLSYVDAIKKLNDDFHLGLDIDKPLDELERKKAREEYRKRQEAQEVRRNREKILFTAYHAALDRYCALDRMKMENLPVKDKLGNYKISKDYVYAIKRIDAAWADVEEAIAKLYEFEKGEENKT